MTELLVRETEVLELAQPGVVIINGGGGGGGVSSVSFTTANGFAATITNPTSTPNITLRTTVTGITKGDGTSLSAAVAGTDYLTPTGSAAGLTGLTSGQVIAALGYTPGSGNGTVTSFAFTNGGGFTGTVNTSTTTPTLSLTLQTASASQSGQLSSADWTTFNNKGNGTVTSFAFTNANGVTGTVSTATTTPTLSISIQTASASQDGLLSSTDWSTFNSKGSGSVTSVSVASANGFGGSVANASTTPAITLTTSVTGLLKGNGTAMSAAVAGTDYLTPTGSAAGLTGLTSLQVTDALTYTPYNATNPSGYISGNQTITFTGDATGSGTTSVTLTIPNDTVTFAKMQNVSSGVLLGRYDASTGNIQEITIGTNLTLTGAGVLNATGGGGGGSGTVTDFIFTDVNGFDGTVSNSTTTPTLSLSYVVPSSGQVFTNATTEPSAPSSGSGKYYARTVAGRASAKFIDDFGIDSELQPYWGQKKVRGMLIGGDSNTTPGLTYLAQAAYSAVGTATSRTPSGTGLIGRAARVGWVSASTAGSFASIRSSSTLITIGDGAGLGGFKRVIRFACTDAATVSGARQFVGLRNSIAAPTNVEPNTLTNVIGIGNGASDTNMQIFYGGSAAQTPIDLGVNFPANSLSTHLYELVLFAPPTSNNTVYYQVTRLDTGTVQSGTLTGTAGVALPSSSTYLSHMWSWRCNNATSLAVGLDFFLDYCETNY